jgi:hypothetical protein
VLLRESASGPPRKPPGDVVLSSFPKIFDCPDILEELAQVWNEDLQPAIDKQKRNIELIVSRTKEAITRLYPALYSEAFEPRAGDATLESAVGDPERLKLRVSVIQSALRYGAVHAVKFKQTQSPADLTTFKPFAVRELEYEVWDTSRAEQEGFRAQFGALGLLAQPQVSASFNSSAQRQQEAPAAGARHRGSSPSGGARGAAPREVSKERDQRDSYNVRGDNGRGDRDRLDSSAQFGGSRKQVRFQEDGGFGSGGNNQRQY